MNQLDARYNRLIQVLRSLRRVAVAYSGGVDSTLLLHLAYDLLGTDAMGIIARSEMVPDHEYNAAVQTAREIGVRLKTVVLDVLSDPAVRANPPDRCYYCKRFILQTIKAAADTEGFAVVVEGSNLDDLSDYRPGGRAVRELKVLSPLVTAELSKSDVRDLSRKLGLKTWNHPASPCLATRIPYGEPLTTDRLSRVERAERFFREHGVMECRVRDHGEIARVELPGDQLGQLAGNDTLRIAAVKRLTALGFRFVTLDLRGYIRGSMNRVLDPGIMGKHHSGASPDNDSGKEE